ncbi:hypothetical protein D018_2946A, partial [Vibrio parahaemolyticus VP2007-007]
MDTHV